MVDNYVTMRIRKSSLDKLHECKKAYLDVHRKSGIEMRMISNDFMLKRMCDIYLEG